MSGHLVIPGSFVVVIGGVDSVDNRPFLHVGCWLTVCVHCGRRGRRRWMGVDGRRGGFALSTGSDEMSPLHWPVIHIYPQVCVDMSGSLEQGGRGWVREPVRIGPQTCPQAVDKSLQRALAGAWSGVGLAWPTGVDDPVDGCGSCGDNSRRCLVAFPVGALWEPRATSAEPQPGLRRSRPAVASITAK